MVLDTIILMASWQIKGLQMFASLSLLILLHEFGHYMFAKLFKTRVEKFYLFFDFLFPFSHVLNFSLFKKKIGDTVYGIGWFPLGGYVKIAGMVDESMDKEELAQPPKPWEFRSKPAWQRLFIMLGGIIMNILTAVAIYAFVFGTYGEEYIPTSGLPYGIVVDSLGEKIGLQDGDQILGVNGKPVERFSSIPGEIILDQAKDIEISRNGQNMTLPIPSGTISKMLKSEKGAFLAIRLPAVIGEVSEHSKAAQIGLKKGDSIISISHEPIRFWDEFLDAKNAAAGTPMTIEYVRNGSIQSAALTLAKDSVLGIAPDPERYIHPKLINYSFFPALKKGITYTGDQFSFYWRQFKLLFTSKEVKVSENLGGFASFAKIFPNQFDWQTWLNMTAFISIILAFMNLLPIPGLDGGYVFFLLIEMITGRKMSDKFMEVATTIGLVLLLILMVWANGLDIFRAFKN